MSDPGFDPAAYYDFDLARGTVRARSGARVLVLSDSVLGPLVSSAAANGDLTSVRRLGKQLGEQVVDSLGGSPDAASPEAVLTQACYLLGLYGFGRLGLERWGDALVAAIADAPELDEAQLGLAALLGGVFTSLGGREVACVPAELGKFVLVDPGIADLVFRWSQEGMGLAGILGHLVPGEPS
ncbi:MAG: hypothetical protein U0230_19590 [Polyangiales bacterium]